jgi:PAS domain S-box-containing protein
MERDDGSGTSGEYPMLKNDDPKKAERTFKQLLGHYYVLLPLVACAGIAVSLALFSNEMKREQKQIQISFNRASEDRISSLQRGIEESLQELESISAFYAASRSVTRKEFHEFVQPFIIHNPSIQALAWAPRVPGSLRKAYEQDAVRDGLQGFHFTEQDPQGALVKAGKRREYYPEYFYEPARKNEPALGFDLATEPVRFAALEQARDTGKMTATSRLTLVQDVRSQYGLLVFQPVYRAGRKAVTVAARRGELAGFALGIFRVGDMMAKSLSYLKHQDIDIHLFDETAAPGRQFLYAYPPAAHAAPHKSSEEIGPLEKGLYYARTIEVAGRKWTFLCQPTLRYVASRRTLQPWGILGSGLLTTGFLSVFIFLIIRRTVRTQQFADQLVKAKEALEREAAMRAQTEQTLRESERRYRSLFENMLEGFAYCEMIYENGQPRDFVYLDVNAAFEKLTGLTDVVGKRATEVIPGLRENYPELIETYARVSRGGEPERFEAHSELFGGWLFVTAYGAGQDAFIAVFDNITERKQHEREMEAISALSKALRSAATPADQFRIVLEHVSGPLRVDGAAIAMRDRATGETIVELGSGKWETWTGLRFPPGEGVLGRVISTGLGCIGSDAAKGFPSDMLEGLNAVACVPLIAETRTIGALVAGCDTSIRNEEIQLLTAVGEIAAIAIHRRFLHEQALRHVRRLSALHEIDVAISSSLDLHLTLNVLLGHVVRELRADTAAVFLLNRDTQTLTFAAGVGFLTAEIEQARIRLGQGCAGLAALDRRIVGFPNAEAEGAQCSPVVLKGENFVSRHAAPLIVKGKVKGVLEILNRSPLVPDREWRDFFEALAGQAAIAIDNAALFNDLQRANDELFLAYDETIEGWSRALDLRDKETEGHSLRVTEMTVSISRAMGMSEEDLVHIRRGALLHDIGKVGIPDGILLKPGKLTEEEWEIMRKHPQFAFDLLSPIKFLKTALDIPYYHHEKWDGTGYPLGLKGGQIPLAARVFSVVDVWDALGSDRPYRPAWPREKMVQYMKERAGKDFDPEIVKIFLEQVAPAASGPDDAD